MMEPPEGDWLTPAEAAGGVEGGRVSAKSWWLRSPDWVALRTLLDEVCRDQGLVTKSGRPNYNQLGHLCGVSHGTLSAWCTGTQRPSQAALEKVAAYAGQPLGPWLAAAGLDATEGGAQDPE